MNTRSLGRALSRLVYLLAAALVLAASSLAAASSEQGRWKLGSQGCYWDASDSGPDQCSPNAGRWKVDATHCYWDPNDSGPNQCDPTQPFLPDSQANGWVAGISYLANAGLNIDGATTEQAEVARHRSNIPMSRFPQEFIEFANGFKGITETVLVTGQIVPNSYNFFNVEPLPPHYGQVPVVIIPTQPYKRVWSCSEKIERQRNLKQASLFWRDIALGGTAFSAFSKDHPRYGQYSTRAAKFTVVAAGIALFLDELYVARDQMPCVNNEG